MGRNIRARLEEALASVGFPDPGTVVGKLLLYVDALARVSRRVNVTSATTPEEIVGSVVLSALAVVRAWDRDPGPAGVVDLGTGNGFPGIAAALAWPSARVWLVERRGRRAEAVERLLEATGLPHVEVVLADGRDLLRERPDLEGAVDLVTVRAVGSLAEVTRIAAPWLAPGGRIAHWKGRSLDEREQAEGARAARGTGLRVLPLVPGDAEAGPAFLVLYERPRGRP